MFSAITRDAIAAETALSRVGDDQDGAVVAFVGVVRNSSDGAAVKGMRYDAYVEMAESVLRDIVREAAALAGSDRVAAVHRIGELQVGEASVAIAVSSPHRAEAFEACRYIIEEIKKRLPVWKQEHYTQGSAWLNQDVVERT